MKPAIKKTTAGLLSAVLFAAALPMQEASAEVTASKREQFRSRVYTAWNRGLKEVSLGSLRMTLDEVCAEYYDMIFTDADWFFVSSAFRYNLTTFGSYVSGIEVEYNFDTAEIPDREVEFGAAVTGILSGIQDSWSEAEKVLYLHDYLAEHCSYDLSLQNMDAYTAIVTGCTICQGYALAMCVLCREIGISCYAVTSDDLNHMWNVVNVDGEWYHLDVTFDDSAPDMLGHAGHDYVLQSDAAMYADDYHHADDWNYFSDGNKISCTSDLYANAFWIRSADTMDGLEDGSWVYADSVQASSVMTGSDVSATIYRRTPDGRRELLKTVAETWKASSGYVYPRSYVSTQVYNDRIYYHTADSIYEMSLTGDNEKLIYTLSAKEKAKGSIYGMVIDDEGLLTYQIMPSAYYADETYQMDMVFNTLQLEKPGQTVTDPYIEPETTTSATVTTTTTATPTTTTAIPTTTTAIPTTTTAIPTTTTAIPTTTTAIPTTTTAIPTTTTAIPTTTTAIPTTTTAIPTTTTAIPTTTTAIPTTTSAIPTATTTTETTTLTTTTEAVPMQVTLRGDVNLDGEVDVADVVLLARYLVEDGDAVVSEQGKLNADMNGSGAPDIMDNTMILRKIAKLD